MAASHLNYFLMKQQPPVVMGTALTHGVAHGSWRRMPGLVAVGFLLAGHRAG
jgi:hypothetical protein